jgi:hypothetical protein
MIDEKPSLLVSEVFGPRFSVFKKSKTIMAGSLIFILDYSQSKLEAAQLLSLVVLFEPYNRYPDFFCELKKADIPIHNQK